MPGPWEQYAEPAGPWEAYGTQVSDADRAMRAAAEKFPITETEPTLSDAIVAGAKRSVFGTVATRGEQEKQQAFNWYQRAASNVTSLAADAPFMVIGGALGAVPGSAAGPVGTVMGAGAGAFALPEALRQVMIEGYGKGWFKDWGDFWSRFTAATLQTGKSAVLGAAIGPAGAAGKALVPVAAPAIAKTGAELASQVTTMATLGSAMEGRVPSAQDFLDNAILLSAAKGVMHAAGVDRVSEKLRKTYADTGMTPEEVRAEAERNPTVLQDLVSDNREVPEALSVPKAEETKPETVEEKPAEEVKPSVVERMRSAVRGAFGGKPPEKTPEQSVESEGRSDAEKAVLSRIVTEVPKERRSISEWLHDAYTKVFDERHEILRAQAEAGVKKGEVGPYEAARLTAGSAGRAKQFIENAGFDPITGKNNASSLRGVVDMWKEDPKGFLAYITAKHGLEREAAGKSTGIDVEAMKEVVAKGGKYEAASKAFDKYHASLLNYLVKSGLVSEDARSAMNDAYKSHVSLYRLFDNEERAIYGKKPRNPIKGAKGSERLILDPILSEFENTFLYISLAEQNMARQKFVALGDEFAQKVKAKMRPVEISDQEMARALKEQGVDFESEGFTAFRPQSHNAGPNEMVVFEDGKRNVYKVAPGIKEAFEGLNSGQTSFLVGMLRGAASWLRAGVTLSPDFSPRNIVRDGITAFVYAGSHPLKTLRGAISYFKEDAAYQNWLKGGGANAAMVSMDRRYINQHLYDLEPETHLMGRAWNVVKTPVEALRIVSETMENITRLGIARDELAQAKDIAQMQALSMLTREGTVDFARHGSDPFLRQWTLATAFMNPALQGVDRMVRALKDNPAGTTAKAFAAITIPSLLLWYRNKDDPRWPEVPDWQRDLFWIAFTDNWQKPESEAEALSHAQRGLAKEINGEIYVNKGHTFRIPKPFEIGVLFGSMPERIMDAYVADKPDAFKHFGKTLTNVFGINVIPTVAVPMVQQATNYDFFRDRPLVPDSMKNLLPEYQYASYTTEATRALGSLIGSFPGMKDSSFASPIVIDNYIRGWSGTLGGYAVQIADAALQKAGILRTHIEPTKTLAEMPVIKAFMIREPSASAQSIQDFYDHHDRALKQLATIRHEAMLGHTDAVLKEMQVNPVMLEKLESVRQGLANANRMIQLVQENPEFTPDEKRQIIDSAYGQMILMARTGNTMIQQLKKVFGQSTYLPAPATIQ